MGASRMIIVPLVSFDRLWLDFPASFGAIKNLAESDRKRPKVWKSTEEEMTEILTCKLV